jgi:hypothetical protein
MTLIEALQTVPDPRHQRGKRHLLWVLLVFVVMGNLAGYQGNRPLQEFSQRYGHHIVQLLGIEVDSLASYSTFRRLQRDVDFMAFSTAFAEWMQQTAAGDDFYSVDGKRIAQPLTGSDGKTRFAGLVSVFSQRCGLTVDLAALTCDENSEIKVVPYLIQKLNLQRAILSLDALHAPKKHCQ